MNMTKHWPLSVPLLGLLISPLGCGGHGGQVDAKPSIGEQSTISHVPKVTDPPVNPGKEPTGGGNGAAKSKPKPPRIDASAPEELRKLIAAVAKDPPPSHGGALLRRVTIVKTSGGEQFVVVSLTDSLVDDEGLAAVARVDHVGALYLDNCREISPAGLSQLQGLSELQKLSLSRTAVDDRSLQFLRGMPRLAELNLFGNDRITDEGMRALSQCRSLRTIKLQETRVGDEGLRQLKGLSALQEIWLDGTQVTEAGLRELEAARPGIKIRHNLRRRMSP
jgi:hypothetical protein